MLHSRVAKLIKRVTVGIETVAEQQERARRLRPEWQEYLDSAEYAFKHDALSGDLVSLEDIGFEEAVTETLHGLAGVPDIVAWWSDGEDCRYESN